MVIANLPGTPVRSNHQGNHQIDTPIVPVPMKPHVDFLHIESAAFYPAR